MKTNQPHKVTCPYCHVGYGVCNVEQNGTSRTIHRDAPIECQSCHNYFLVQPMIQLRGVGLDYRKDHAIEKAPAWLS